MAIDTTKLSKEIKDKYSIVSNAFRLVEDKSKELDGNGKPKDLITVEIGDTKQEEFFPQVKLCRWGDSEEDNEVNFSIRLKDEDTKNIAIVSTDKDKIIWDKGNIFIENYSFNEGEGGYKFVWHLKEKPASNKVEFTIQSKGLDFFYQPPLTEEYQNGYSDEFQKEIVVTETQVKDLDGNVLVERPENVVGSYAVYHSTKGGMNDAYGKDYKTGQAFFIYPSHLTDAEGKTGKAILKIENGIFSEEIPQDFFDKATFPIKGNTNFGYETGGGTQWLPQYQVGSLGTLSEAGTGVSMSVYCDSIGAPSGDEVKAGLYNSDATTVRLTTEGTVGAEILDWITMNFVSAPSLSAASYRLAVHGDETNGFRFRYNTSAGLTAIYKNLVYPASSFPDPWTGTTNFTNSIFSIYATYTPSGGGAAANPHHLSSTGVGS